MNIKELQEAYERGEPLVPDSVYDQLDVSHEPIGPAGTSKHFKKMYSLKKFFDLKKAPIDVKLCVKTPKLDGLAVALIYVYGKFHRAVTRGDGEYGVDVTHTVQFLAPKSLPLKNAVTQVTGEIVCQKPELNNARNIAAGAVNVKSLNEFTEKKSKYAIQFVAYDCSEFTRGSWSEQMKAVFPTSVLTIAEKDYPIDGYVFRLDNLTECYNMGYTHKEPRWAFALKSKGEQKTTVVREVTWQLGKGGKITPVAIFDPVVIDGAEIKRATLHNAKYVEDLQLNLNDTIIIERSGGVIPHVVGKKCGDSSSIRV